MWDTAVTQHGYNCVDLVPQMGCTLGTKVGYAVRFDQKVDSGGSKTAIKFVTDGLLLREVRGTRLWGSACQAAG